MSKVLYCFLTVVLMVGCSQRASYRQNQGFVFGTIYNITYESATDWQSEIEAELQKVDNEFSMFNEQSTVARLNRGESVDTSAMFREVYLLAQKVNQDTDGAFDISVAPLVNAWGFGFKHQQMPTPEQVDSLLKIRDQMDFSAIAKGYGCDVVARLLEQKGVSNYMVEIGGEVVLKGENPRQTLWHVGVTKPVEDSLSTEGELQAVLTMTDRAMATGYPVQHNILSATVLADDCATADAYATSFMVLGMDGAKAVLARHPELEAYLIYTDAQNCLQVWYSPTLGEKIAE